MRPGAVLTRGHQTATTWSMTAAVLIEDTSTPIELRYNSVELTQDIRDYREIIDQISKEFEFDHSVLDGLHRDIEDAKERIYQAALRGSFELVQSTSKYASGIEEHIRQEQQRIDSVRSERLAAVHDQLGEFVSRQYGLADTSALEYFVPAMNSFLSEVDDTIRGNIPFLFDSELEQQAISIFVKQSLSGLDLSAEYEDDLKMNEVVRELPLPMYGSKPERLTSLSSLIQTGASVGAIGYSEYLHNPVMLIATLTGSFVIWFAKPHFTTLRDHTNKWVEDWSKDRLRYRHDD